MSGLIREQSGVITDYSGFHRGVDRFLSASPASLAELEPLLEHARREGMTLRVQGRHHSMNGSSLPREGELLIFTAGLDHFRCERPGTITVGAGAVVFEVDQLVRDWGFQLKLVNDGGKPTASAAGFVSAGGIGAETWISGGFWETVEAVTAYTVEGERLELSPSDPLFRWLFGSMGQLVFIAEVTLAIEPAAWPEQPEYPLGRSGVVAHEPYEWEKNFWLTLFVPDDDAPEARELLERVADDYHHAWKRRSNYLYPIEFRRFNPPLIYPKDESFSAVGIWGQAPERYQPFNFEELAKMDQHFDEILRTKPQWRRYIQSEMTFGQRDWESTFGAGVYAEFRGWKDKLDPDHRLNPGVVFPGPSGSVS